MGLLSIIAGASKAKENLLNSFADTGFASAVTGQRDDLIQAKGDMLNPAMRSLGFGNADQITMPSVRNFDTGMAVDSAKLMQSTLASGGIMNPAAGMVQLGAMDLQTPDMTKFFSPAEDDGYMTPLEREAERFRLEEASQGTGMLNDPNQFTPTPEAGVLRMS